MLDKLVSLSGDTLKAAQASKWEEAATLHATLKAQCAEMKTNMFEHLAEEERFWPEVLLRHGEKKNAEHVQLIVAIDLKKKVKELLAFKVFAGAILDNMGYQASKQPPSLPTALQLAPWCTEAQAAKFVGELPFVPRVFFSPAFASYMSRSTNA